MTKLQKSGGAPGAVVFIWGMGLIGASLGLSLQKRGYRISGSVRSERSKKILNDLGFCEVYTDESEILAALGSADILVVALNIREAQRALAAVLSKPELAARLIVFDICSTKAEICKFVEERFPEAKFIGSHPMAGKEKHGPEAAEPDLFEGATVYLTPLVRQDEALRAGLVRDVSAIWKVTGANTAVIEADQHDRMMASVSHGLHLLSCLVARRSLEAMNPPPPLSPVAGSYRDMTRIAMSSGAMWSEIIASNKNNVVQWLRSLSRDCEELAAGLESGDADIEKLFSEARSARTLLMRT